MKEVREKIIVPLDVSSREQALALVQQLHDLVGLFKVGSQLFTACGPEIVLEIIKIGGKVFLDLKFHDIPNTVTHAAIEAGKLGVSMMTVHASGGRAMLESASKELQKQFGAKKPLLLAITVLTSLDTKSLFEIGIEVPVEEQVQRSAIFAQECGVDGVVCSPREIRLVRQRVDSGFKIVTPGIRMADHSLNDQQRIATPHEAISAGADYIVIGRPITEDPDPRAAAERVLQSI
jgi:orotidine-5'-phosphate decarboxylase